MELKSWNSIETQILHSSRWLQLRRDTCRLPSDRIIDDYFVVEVPDGVTVVALTENKEVVLVRQYKHGLRQIVLELPAGMVDPEEDHAVTIARELKEETGYSSKDMQYITTLATKPARMSARTSVYFAESVVLEVQPEIKDTETIETVLIPIAELTKVIQSGAIITETSLAALMMVWSRIFNNIRNH